MIMASYAGEVASSSEMAEVEDVLEDWMEPIPAEKVAEGTYEVQVNCSSSMFPIESCELNVIGGQMLATMTMGGTGYLYVYPGTAEEAAEADESSYIPFVENEEGKHTFTIPVKALDDVTDCAAFSKRKEKWYERSLVFVSTSLPAEALPAAEKTTAEDLGLTEGSYLVDALLEGGSGKASIESPAVLTYDGETCMLQVVFSSPHYDYMLVDDVRYDRVNTEGNSMFLIPVDGFDYRMSVVADTTAMSKPHEISYTILLDSKSIKADE